MTTIKKILSMENHDTYAIVNVETDKGDELAVYVGGRVEAYFDDKFNKAKGFVMRPSKDTNI